MVECLSSRLSWVTGNKPVSGRDLDSNQEAWSQAELARLPGQITSTENEQTSAFSLQHGVLTWVLPTLEGRERTMRVDDTPGHKFSTRKAVIFLYSMDWASYLTARDSNIPTWLIPNPLRRPYHRCPVNKGQETQKGDLNKTTATTAKHLCCSPKPLSYLKC